MLVMALALAQAATASAPPATAPTTLQAQFEQANDALDAGQWQQAFDGFTRAEAWPTATPRAKGIAQLRKGIALIHLRQTEDGLAALRSGLGLTAGGGPSLSAYRTDAAMEIGNAARRDYDSAGAQSAFELIMAEASDPGIRTAALLNLAELRMFDDPRTALIYSDQAAKLLAAAKPSSIEDARLHDVRGRVLLNKGDFAGAISELQIAEGDLGGLKSKIDSNDAIVRSDLAIAHLRAGHPNEAQKIMALTGAGQVPGDIFTGAAHMDLPPCTEALHPEDVAVIEFGVTDQGTVYYATPVYASRLGMPVADFARAVRNWAWGTDEIGRIPLFFRVGTRVEMRCSTASERPSVVSALAMDIGQWFDARQAGPVDIMPSAKTIPIPVAALQTNIDRAGGGTPAILIKLLAQLGNNPLADRPTREAAFSRALDLARKEGAPPPVLAWLILGAAMSDDDFGSKLNARVTSLLHAADGAELATDPRARAALILSASDIAQHRQDAALRSAVEAVVRDRRLDVHDPLYVGALLRLSDMQAATGKLEEARKNYLDTGLSTQQCALVDAKPALLKLGVSSNDYPVTASEMGVSGWTRVEFDVLPDGHTTNRRAVLSYPPFTFGDGAVSGMKYALFTQTYRPGGGLGCGGASAQFNFLTMEASEARKARLKSKRSAP